MHPLHLPLFSSDRHCSAPPHRPGGWGPGPALGVPWRPLPSPPGFSHVWLLGARVRPSLFHPAGPQLQEDTPVPQPPRASEPAPGLGHVPWRAPGLVPAGATKEGLWTRPLRPSPTLGPVSPSPRPGTRRAPEVGLIWGRFCRQAEGEGQAEVYWGPCTPGNVISTLYEGRSRQPSLPRAALTVRARPARVLPAAPFPRGL